VLKNEALQLPDVLSVTGSRHHLGESEGRESAIIDGESVSIVYFDVGPNYFETVGLRLKTGQFINDTGAVVINEVFARTRGWTESLGQTIRFEDTVYTVVGVVEDFHYRDFEDPIMPALFRLGDESEFQYLTLRVNTGAGVESALALKNTWERLVPGTPFEYFFQNEVFEQFFQESGGITRVFTFVAIIALLISCLGLFGLASQNIASRLKEISIRKVLGASVPHITQMANRRFLLLLSIGALVATPLSYLIMNTLLDDIYTYRMSIGPSSCIFADVLVFITASLTIATQVYKLISTNPVEVLRNE
jgi:putative ABC transport system permease protein